MLIPPSKPAPEYHPSDCPYRTLRWRDMTKTERDRVRVASSPPPCAKRVTAQGVDVVVRFSRVVSESDASVCLEVSGSRREVPRGQLRGLDLATRMVRLPRWLAVKHGWL